MSVSLRFDRVVGREVYAANNRRIGRLHEVRAERRGSTWVIAEYVIGAAGLMERLGLGVRLILGFERPTGYVGGGIKSISPSAPPDSHLRRRRSAP